MPVTPAGNKLAYGNGRRKEMYFGYPMRVRAMVRSPGNPGVNITAVSGKK
jgi:hypothetical protein